MMTHFIAIFIFFLPSYVYGQAEKLIGKNIQDHDLQVFIQNLGQRSEILSSTTQYAYPAKGIKLEFYAGKQLEAAELHNSKTKQGGEIYQRYIGELPLSLSFEMNRKQVTRLLGKSDFFTNDYLQYNRHEITLMIYADEKQIEKILIRRRSCVRGDCLNGYGIFISRTGEKYEGSWKQGARSGRGICYYVNGDKYEGQWLDNELNGEGKMTLKDGTIKNGLWEKGRFKGEIRSRDALLYSLLGKHKTNNAIKLLTETYGGGFKEVDLSQDYTSYLFNNQKLTLIFDEYGYLTKINLKNSGLQDFSGTITSALPSLSDEKYIRYALGAPREVVKGENGNIYIYQDGESWVHIRFNKKLMLNAVDFKVLGNTSPLIFQKKPADCKKGNCYEGYGELNQAGNFYKGNFKDELFEGQGEIHYFSGGTYKGHFHQGRREGKGKYIWKDKGSYEGEWKNNQKNGAGTMIYPNGDKFVGHWLNDMRTGEGTLYKTNGKKISGTWEFDELKHSFTLNK